MTKHLSNKYLSTDSLTKTVGGVAVRLTVRCATVGDGMRRGMLAGMASREPLKDSADQTVAIVIYPRCVAVSDGVVVIGGKEIPVNELTPAEFVALPEQIGNVWFEMVIEKNPHWDLSDDKDDAEKKG
jgi:hypothetical protein